MVDLTAHAPESPFGCSSDWGDRIGGLHWSSERRIHVCNLDHHHEGDHVCKCGETKARVPGPPPIPKCRECGRVVHHRGHAPECPIGQEQAVHFGNVRAVEDALRAAVDGRRQDREFMARLLERIEADGVILERLAGVQPNAAPTEVES